MDTTILDNKKQSLSINYTPTYEQLITHPEEGEDFRINNSFVDIYNDMNQFDVLMMNQAILLQELMDTTNDRLNTVDMNIKAEQERLQDIKMLCNKYTDFDNVIPINKDTAISGSYSISDDTFFCEIKSYRKSNTTIVDIIGNGVEGNKYVYKDEAYVQDSMDTSVRKYINDSSTTSYYEYERITASSTEDYLLSDFNTDSEAAKCTVILKAKEDINLITVTSDDTTVHVIGVQYSYDGIEYYPLDIPDIIMNNKQYCYDNSNYICGSNKISVPSCQYVKITFQSVGTTDDIIAYDRVMFSHEDVHQSLEDSGLNYVPITTTRATYNDLKDATIIVKSAKRHNIKLNDIELSSNVYTPNSYFTTGNLISSGKFYAVALFANIYIPEDLDYDSVQFTFNINGIDYDVTPVNIEGNGKKVFRYSQGKGRLDYTQILDEPIKNLYLTIKIHGSAYSTPFINNLKVLLGGEI